MMLTPSAEDSYNDDRPSVLIDLVTKQLTVKREEKEEVIEFRDLI